MNFDSVVIAGGLPLGVFVSAVLSFLKGKFGLSSEQARNVVAGCGFLYAVGVGLLKVPTPLGSVEGWFDLVTNAIASGVSLIFGSEGFYQWVQKMEQKMENQSERWTFASIYPDDDDEHTQKAKSKK